MVGIIVGSLQPERLSAGDTATAEPPPLKRWLGLASALAVVAFTLLLMAVHGLRIYRYDTNSFLVRATPNQLAQALIWAPTQCQIWHLLGQHAYQKGTRRGTRLAEYCLTEGVRHNPNDYRIWYHLSVLRSELGDELGAVRAMGNVLRLRPYIGDALERREATQP